MAVRKTRTKIPRQSKDKGSLIEVRDERGRVVFEGRGRRRFKEQSFYDSKYDGVAEQLPHGPRLFKLSPKKKKIGKSRLKELQASLPEGVKLPKNVHPDLRNPKNRKKYLEKRDAKR
jgi:hypothetical protein